MKQEINEYEDKFLQFLRTSNVEALTELLHDDLIYNNPVGKVLDKQMDIEDFKSSNPVIEKLDCLERKIELFGDTAIVSTVIELKGVFMNTPVEGRSRFLRIWKKFGEGWKIIGAASINLE